jgi:putative chitinase
MDINKLKGYIPDAVIAMFPDVMEKFELNTLNRLSHFLSQAGHESGDFKVVTENLNYNAKALCSVFHKYFPTNEKAALYEHKPEKIANLIYSNRMGNGDETSGDGYKFRGRGFIQLTGKSNYIAFGNAIDEDIVSNPDLISSTYPLLSAAWFFHNNKLHQIADEGITDEIVTKITKKINGGTNGLDDRIKRFNKYYNLIK